MVACNPLSHEFSTTDSKDAFSLRSCSARCGDSRRPRVCIQRDVGLTDVIASLETPGSNAVSWSSLQAHPPMDSGPICVALRKTRKLQLVFEGLMMISSSKHEDMRTPSQILRFIVTKSEKPFVDGVRLRRSGFSLKHLFPSPGVEIGIHANKQESE